MLIFLSYPHQHSEDSSGFITFIGDMGDNIGFERDVEGWAEVILRKGINKEYFFEMPDLKMLNVIHGGDK